MNDYYDEHDDFDDEPITAYCVSCRQKVDIEEPEPVWTRKGLPATRGHCPICGTTVFRMGRTPLHDDKERPAAVQVGTQGKRNAPKLPQNTVYVAYAVADTALAEKLANDLQKVGVAVWLHEHEPDGVKWAGGVHPALKQCARMLVLLSPAIHEDALLETAWRYFRDKRKPIIIAQASPAEPPDAIRRSPRFDFSNGDYKTAFRQMVQELNR